VLRAVGVRSLTHPDPAVLCVVESDEAGMLSARLAVHPHVAPHIVEPPASAPSHDPVAFEASVLVGPVQGLVFVSVKDQGALGRAVRMADRVVGVFALGSVVYRLQGGEMLGGRLFGVVLPPAVQQGHAPVSLLVGQGVPPLAEFLLCHRVPSLGRCRGPCCVGPRRGLWFGDVLVIQLFKPGGEIVEMLQCLLLRQLRGVKLPPVVSGAGQCQQELRFSGVVDGEHWQPASGP
jgi:hypothetical protein